MVRKTEGSRRAARLEVAGVVEVGHEVLRSHLAQARAIFDEGAGDARAGEVVHHKGVAENVRMRQAGYRRAPARGQAGLSRGVGHGRPRVGGKRRVVVVAQSVRLARGAGMNVHAARVGDTLRRPVDAVRIRARQSKVEELNGGKRRDGPDGARDL